MKHLKIFFVLFATTIIGVTGCSSSNNSNSSTTVQNSEQMNQSADENLAGEFNDSIIAEEAQEQVVNEDDIGKTFCEDSYEYTILEDGTAMISCYSDSAEVVRIPEKLGGYTISQIGSKSIINDSIVELTIPGTIKIIKEGAIQCPNLDVLILEDGVEIIEYEAFRNTRNIKTLVLPDSIIRIDAYIGNFATECYDGIKYIGTIACGTDSSIKEWDEICIREGTTGISGRAFYDKDNTPNEIKIPDGVKFIGQQAFCSSGIGTYYIPSSVCEIGTMAIGYYKLNGEFKSNNQCKIYGYEGTSAETYAEKNRMNFVTLR